MHKGSDYQKHHQHVADTVGITVDKLQKDECAAKFPYIHFEDCDEAWFESTAAGYINPRELVRAEQTIAVRSGCTIIEFGILFLNFDLI